MNNEMIEAIKCLKVISPKLDEATEQATRVVQAVEKVLGEEYRIEIPVRVVVSTVHRVEVSEERDDAFDTGHRTHVNDNLLLGYEWCRTGPRVVVLRTVTNSSDEAVEPEHVTLWVEARPEEMLRTFAAMPELLNAINRVAARTLEETETVFKVVGEALEALGKK